MSNRSFAYQQKAPDYFDERVQIMQDTRLFLMQTSGPTCYTIRNEEGSNFKVYLGDRQMCSCGGGKKTFGLVNNNNNNNNNNKSQKVTATTSTKIPQLCIHIIFLMVKVLKVPSTNPLSWQLSLVDSEVTQILQGRHNLIESRSSSSSTTTTNNKHKFLKRGSQQHGSDSNLKNVDRHPLDPDEVCPICQDDMNEEDGLTFCKKGCGNNVHLKCMKMYADHQRTQKTTTNSKIQCPLCRTDWGAMAHHDLQEELDIFQKKPKLMTQVIKPTCENCKAKTLSTFYRCITCQTTDFNLCRRCFAISGSLHIDVNRDHNFVEIEPLPIINGSQNCNIKAAFTSQQNLMSNDLISNLQTRELTQEDFNLLLQLDEQKTSVPHHLLKNLHTVKENEKCHIPEDQSLCVICEQNLGHQNEATTTTVELKKLPCEHIVHESCILSATMSVENNLYGDFNCPSCQTTIYPRMNIIRKKDTSKSKNKKGQDSKKMKKGEDQKGNDKNINQRLTKPKRLRGNTSTPESLDFSISGISFQTATTAATAGAEGLSIPTTSTSTRTRRMTTRSGSTIRTGSSNNNYNNDNIQGGEFIIGNSSSSGSNGGGGGDASMSGAGNIGDDFINNEMNNSSTDVSIGIMRANELKSLHNNVNPDEVYDSNSNLLFNEDSLTEMSISTTTAATAKTGRPTSNFLGRRSNLNSLSSANAIATSALARRNNYSNNKSNAQNGMFIGNPSANTIPEQQERKRQQREQQQVSSSSGVAAGAAFSASNNSNNNNNNNNNSRGTTTTTTTTTRRNKRNLNSSNSNVNNDIFVNPSDINRQKKRDELRRRKRIPNTLIQASPSPSIPAHHNNNHNNNFESHDSLDLVVNASSSASASASATHGVPGTISNIADRQSGTTNNNSNVNNNTPIRRKVKWKRPGFGSNSKTDRLMPIHNQNQGTATTTTTTTVINPNHQISSESLGMLNIMSFHNSYENPNYDLIE